MTLRKEEIYTVYSKEHNITFVMRDVFDHEGEPVSLEVVGFHFGEPSKESLRFVGETMVEFWGEC